MTSSSDDMRRMDKYPDIDDSTKGISPWFRAGLIGTHEKGFMAGLGWEGLVREDEDVSRYPDTKNREKPQIMLMLTGFIPYENVESIDWQGDDYYRYLHVYCYFDHKGEPYEGLAFCERRGDDRHEYYHELIGLKSVQKRTRNGKIKY